jgi:hypothetical protein
LWSSQRKQTKVEAFGNLKFLPSLGESAQELKRSTTAIRSAGREIWTIDFYVQEELRRSLQKEETDSRWISLRNPVSHWIGRRRVEVKPLEERREGEQI